MSYLLLNESPEKILSLAQLQKNKLQAMKDQLDLLLSKKIRLDNEIKILRKSIKNKSKNFQISLKTSINLEAYSPELEPTLQTKEFLEENFSDLSFLKEYDQLLEEIDDLLEEVQTIMGN